LQCVAAATGGAIQIYVNNVIDEVSMPFFICLSSVQLSVFDGLLTRNLGLMSATWC